MNSNIFFSEIHLWEFLIPNSFSVDINQSNNYFPLINNQSMEGKLYFSIKLLQTAMYDYQMHTFQQWQPSTYNNNMIYYSFVYEITNESDFAYYRGISSIKLSCIIHMYPNDKHMITIKVLKFT